MLKRLRIRNFVLIEDVTFEFAEGLNVITGETGAGKSLALSALGLLLGAKAATSSVREGCDAARIEAEFVITSEISAWLHEAKLSAQGDVLPVARVLRRAGRGSWSIGEHSVSAARLSEFGRTFAEFAFQHAHVEVGSDRSFIAGLDALAGHAELLSEYSAIYAELARARAELRALEAGLAEKEPRRVALRKHLLLLDELAPRSGEFRRARERLEVLRRCRQYLELAARVRLVLADREPSVEEDLALLARSAHRAGGAAAPARALCEALERAEQQVQECLRAAERLELAVESEPRELEMLEERCATLERAAQALAADPDDLADAQAIFQEELSRLDGGEERLRLAAAAEQAAAGRAFELAERLHAGRMAQVPKLEQRIECELAQLSLEGAELRLDLRARPREALDATGNTEIAVRFAANPGESFGPLCDVASGGERSRLVLALRSLGLDNPSKTLIFDETDAGVGGVAADAIALRLARLAANRQVLCVTHQACIAAHADRHSRVLKIVENGRTGSKVSVLTGADRIDELARMLAGSHSGQSARALALDLMRSAARRSASRAA